ncbi:helix-turn-helix transcriptional regulator [Pseudomonas sp. DC3000-4b1]|uniref:helix-turn-helix transcriptional regulator n=1 Tax=unclassified Pseudomonas TaxID=196821 RepID=UPI003CF3767D
MIPEPVLPPTPMLCQWHARLARALAAVGDETFVPRLCDALVALGAETLVVCLERKSQAPELIHAQGLLAPFRDEIVNRYFTAGYLLDPFCLAVESGLSEGFYHLCEIAPDDFFSSEYYKTYYLKCGVTDDCYFIIDIDASTKVSLCLFQGLSQGSVSPAQQALFRAVAPLVLELFRQFSRQGGLAGFGALRMTTPFSSPLHQDLTLAFERFGSDALTEREREISQLILRGHSVKSTAKALGISPETVRMHRKNLYTKLAISSQAELFALFIDWLTQGSPA